MHRCLVNSLEIHSAHAMDVLLSKERMRCDRFSQFFSLIVIDMDASDSVDFKALVEILNKRLRLTDEKGLLLKGGVGVLLPMTDLRGAKVVLQSIRQIAGRRGMEFAADVFTYSGRDLPFRNEGPHDASYDSDPDLSFENDPGAIDTVVEDVPLQFSERPTSANATAQVKWFVRADNDTQTSPTVSTPVFSTNNSQLSLLYRPYPFWKRCMDVVGATIGLAFALPAVVIAAILIKATSKGPVFFRQMRTGQFGKAFAIYKLRTMVVDAEELKSKLEALNERDGPAFKMKNDPRVTRIGVVLRKTGMDELPQLWNVLVGDMAIVGPRPLPCDEDAKCELWQRRRLDTKPGLTCFWQISKSRKISFADWMRMDLRYTDSRTIFGDLRLIFKTVMAVFLGRVGH